MFACIYIVDYVVLVGVAILLRVVLFYFTGVCFVDYFYFLVVI